MKIVGDTFILSSGRRFTANRGIIGIDSGLSLYSGYDEALNGANSYGILGTSDFSYFTKEELSEIGKMMVNLWEHFLESLEEQPE